MQRVLLVASLVSATACHSNGQSTPSAQADSAAPRAQAATQQVKVTEDLLQRYIPFEKEHRQAIQDYVVKSKGRVADIGAATDLGQTTEALRQKWKISADEQGAADHLFGSISTNQQMWERLGGKQALAQLEKQQEEMAKQQVKMPAHPTPEQREFLKNMQDLQQNLAATMPKSIADAKRVRDLTDVREQYGDAVVDYALKNGGSVLLPMNDVIASAAVSAGILRK